MGTQLASNCMRLYRLLMEVIYDTATTAISVTGR
jgi:hypothetical protein